MKAIKPMSAILEKRSNYGERGGKDGKSVNFLTFRCWARERTTSPRGRSGTEKGFTLNLLASDGRWGEIKWKCFCGNKTIKGEAEGNFSDFVNLRDRGEGKPFEIYDKEAFLDRRGFTFNSTEKQSNFQRNVKRRWGGCGLRWVGGGDEDESRDFWDFLLPPLPLCFCFGRKLFASAFRMLLKYLWRISRSTF